MRQQTEAEAREVMDSNDILHAFDVDIKTGRFFWKRPSKYHVEKTGREAGRPVRNHRGKEYWVIRWNGKAHKRGRLMFCVVHGRLPWPCVDHINGDSLDDRPVNLRAATVTQNAWNHKKRARTIDLPMGVRLSGGRFQARIAFHKKQISLGVFNTPEEASWVYQAKRRELYGEFA